MHELRTSRLVLRQWHAEDLAPFAAMNADSAVMAHFPRPMTTAESNELAERQRTLLADGEPGLFAVEVRSDQSFIGFIGLAVPRFEAAFTPCVEVGWRLARSAWGHGFASEGAKAVLAHGFAAHGLDEIVSFTAQTNVRSQAVMIRIGMTHDPADDFDHPGLRAGHRLRPHVLFRIRPGRGR